MSLGMLMNRLESETDAAASLEALQDLALFVRVETMGAAFEETPGEYVANAARRYARLASDEDWLQLMGAMERAHDPGREALARMLGWALARDDNQLKGSVDAEVGACSCGSGGCHEPG